MLPQKDVKELSDILSRLKTVEKFIKDERTTIIRDFGASGKSDINKEIGSDLCYLYSAIEILEDFIETHK